MSNSFGYLDIILLAMIAGFIILRLRNILGRKTGHQDKVYTGFTDKKFDEFKEKIKSQTKKPTIPWKNARYPSIDSCILAGGISVREACCRRCFR